MPKQRSFVNCELVQKACVTRFEKCLAAMEQVIPVVPGTRLKTVIELLYTGFGRAVRQALGVTRMPAMYCLQQRFSLSDEAAENAIYDSQPMREFVRISLARESAPDATTLVKFGRLLQNHEVTRRMFSDIDTFLSKNGVLLLQGALMDAAIIAAAPSTKSKAEDRDPLMHQRKKGNTWHLGMKANIDADTDSGLVHSLHNTPACESDVAHALEALHGKEAHVRLDAGTGVEKRPKIKQAQEQGKLSANIQWHLARKRGMIKQLSNGPLKDLIVAAERTKARIRARVEPFFLGVKTLLQHKRARYKELAKTMAQLYSLFGVVNLVIVKDKFLRQHTQPCVLK